MNNAEGWINHHKKATANSPGKKITKDEVNSFVSVGDAALGGYKHILLGHYNANGEI